MLSRCSNPIVRDPNAGRCRITSKHWLVPAVFIGVFSLLLSPSSRPQTDVIHRSRVHTYYIAADEVNWDYAPTGKNDAMGRPFDDLEKTYMETGPHKIGRVYRKAIYREYTDARFSVLKRRREEDQYLGLVGPIIRAEVGDTIKIFFKNNASRPYSIHPHGLLYRKDSEGAGYNDGTSRDDKSDDAIPPGGMHVYVWEVPERAGPGPNDPSSIVWLYHSHVNEMRDVASGLFGAIIVTAEGKASQGGRPFDVDREVVTFLVSINENESWYINQNIRAHAIDLSSGGSDPTSGKSETGSLGTGFIQSNIRHTINGYMFGSMPIITVKKGERVRWYLLTVGDSNNFHTAHWHGNDVLLRGHRTDTVALSPAQMETVDMVPDNPGIWLFHCHVSDHMMGGMITRYAVNP